MKLKELEERLNNYIEEKKLNTLEGQDTQYSLVKELSKEVHKILKEVLPDRRNYSFSTLEFKNHVYIGNLSYDTKVVDIKLYFKKGNKRINWDWTLCYYINKIEITSLYQEIESIEDAYKKSDDIIQAKYDYREKRADEIIKFMKEHNITLEEMYHFTSEWKYYWIEVDRKLKK